MSDFVRCPCEMTCHEFNATFCSPFFHRLQTFSESPISLEHLLPTPLSCPATGLFLGGLLLTLEIHAASDSSSGGLRMDDKLDKPHEDNNSARLETTEASSGTQKQKGCPFWFTGAYEGIWTLSPKQRNKSPFWILDGLKPLLYQQLLVLPNSLRTPERCLKKIICRVIFLIGVIQGLIFLRGLVSK